MTWPDTGYQKPGQKGTEATAPLFKQTETEKLEWLGAKRETKKSTVVMRTPHSRIAGNQRPVACSLGRGYTWTRVAEGAHCTWWRVIQQRPLECTPFCYGQEATSAPWAGSPCWTSCLLCRLWACPPFRFCTHPSAVDINNIQGYFSQCKFNYRIFIKVEKKNLVKLVFCVSVNKK